MRAVLLALCVHNLIIFCQLPLYTLGAAGVGLSGRDFAQQVGDRLDFALAEVGVPHVKQQHNASRGVRRSVFGRRGIVSLVFCERLCLAWCVSYASEERTVRVVKHH